MIRLIALLFILFTSPILAQNFNAGFIGGFTASQISGDGLAGFDKGGARFGAYISYPLKKKMNFQVEMQYIQKGSKSPSGKNAPSNYTMNLHYIEIPFTLNYELKDGIVIETGFGPGILFSYSEKDEIGELGGVSPSIFALDFLCGLQYQLLGNLKVGIRYGNSLLPIRGKSNISIIEKDQNWYSSSVSFALMYQISR